MRSARLHRREPVAMSYRRPRSAATVPAARPRTESSMAAARIRSIACSCAAVRSPATPPKAWAHRVRHMAAVSTLACRYDPVRSAPRSAARQRRQYANSCAECEQSGDQPWHRGPKLERGPARNRISARAWSGPGYRRVRIQSGHHFCERLQLTSEPNGTDLAPSSRRLSTAEWLIKPGSILILPPPQMDPGIRRDDEIDWLAP